MESIRKLIEPHGLHRLTVNWIEKAIYSSFYPERAKVNFERFIERVVETEKELLFRFNKRNIPWISLLFSGSQMLTDLGMKDPRSLFWALHPAILHSTRFKAEMRRERDYFLKEPGLDSKEALCIFKNRELMRVGWRDLLKWADTVETLEDLSRVADVSIEGALQVAEKEMEERFGNPFLENGKPARFIVLGLGKLGGRELNFSSDIDLMYICDDDGGHTEGGVGPDRMERTQVPVNEFYTRVARRLTSVLNDIGPWGNVYRVDLGLRPEGSRGPIVTTVPAAELYYGSWGQPWERQMLIKARVCAGDPSLGEDFLDTIRPFVYKKYLDFSHLKEIHQMKQKIDKHLVTGRDKYKNNVKLGKGGIREIEFIIQTYRLIYGGKMSWLAETNSLKALHRIFERGLLGNVQYAQLADALLFLRDLENRMQITYGRQVQILPEKEDELQALALKMNMGGREALLKEYRRVTENVHDIFTEFFKEEAADIDEEKREFFLDLDNEEEALNRLTEMKFEKPRGALDSLLHIRDGEPFNHPSSKSRRMFIRLLPELLELIVSMPEKDRTLTSLDNLFSSHLEREGLYEILLELPSAGEVLVTVFSLAQSLSDTLINQPDAFEILSAGVSVVPRHSLNSVPPTISSYDTKLDWLRKEKNAESLRIGISYLISHQDPFILMQQLSDLADEFVEACLKIILQEFRDKGDALTDEGKRIAVIGMGKLGRRELNYESDLDLVFIYGDGAESEAAEANTFYSYICRKLINAIGGISQYGYAYKVDTRLRPEGERGAIAVSEETALQYYAKRGALWERMALCGARVVAGDSEFGKSFLEKLNDFIYSPGLSEMDEEGITAMKRKMERQKIKHMRKVPIKYGRGGIVDIEFLAQKLKLAHGVTMPHIRSFNTLEILETAKKEEWEIPDLPMLIKSYKLFRTVETHLRMETGLSAESLPDQVEKLRAVEEKMERFVPMTVSLVDTVRDAMEGVQKSLGKKV